MKDNVLYKLTKLKRRDNKHHCLDKGFVTKQPHNRHKGGIIS